MKPLKKRLKKALSYMLTLCMVVGLSTNTFAASFDDLQEAISDSLESDSTETTTSETGGETSNVSEAGTSEEADTAEAAGSGSAETMSGGTTETTTGDSAGEITPSESGTTETTPSESGTTETTPSESGSTETTPSESGSTEITSSESGTTETTPSESGSTETTPSESGSTETTPSESGSMETTPSESGSTETAPSESGSTETTPSESGSTETTPSESGSMETTPSESGSTETAPSESGSTETTPSDTTETATSDSTGTAIGNNTGAAAGDTTGETTGGNAVGNAGTTINAATEAAIGELADTASAVTSAILSAVSLDTPAESSSDHENGSRFTHTDGTTHYGYGWSNTLKNAIDGITQGWWAIEVWFVDGLRKVQLNEDITYNAQEDEAKSITINGGKVDLDLNTHTIDGGGRFDIDNPDKVVENGSGQSVIKITNGSTVTISNGGITGGTGGTVSFRNNDPSGKGGASGGGIYSANSNLTLNKVDIHNNHGAGYGGGIFFEMCDPSDQYDGYGNITIEDSNIYENSIYNYGNGGGIYLKGHGGDRVTANMTNVNIHDNDGRSYGGGIRTWGTDIILNNVNVTNNIGWWQGGGIVISSSSHLTMNGGSITGNRVPGHNDEDYNGGGGLYLDGTNDTAELNNVTITGNTTEGRGGGILLYQRPDGRTSTLTLGEGNRIFGNTSPAGRSDIYANVGTTINNVGAAPLAPEGQMYDGWYTVNGKDDKYTGPETIQGTPVDLAGNVTYKVVHEYYTDGVRDGSTETLLFKGIDDKGNGAGFIDADGMAKVTTYNGVSGYAYDAARSIAGNFSLTNVTDNNVITLRYYRTTNAPAPDPTPGTTETESGVPRITGGTSGGSRYGGPGVEIPDTAVPLSGMPVVEILDEDVPLSGMPLVEIPDEAVPLASVPKTGDNSQIWGILTVFFGIGLVWLALDKKRRNSAE